MTKNKIVIAIHGKCGWVLSDNMTEEQIKADYKSGRADTCFYCMQPLRSIRDEEWYYD